PGFLDVQYESGQDIQYQGTFQVYGQGGCLQRAEPRKPGQPQYGNHQRDVRPHHKCRRRAQHADERTTHFLIAMTRRDLLIASGAAAMTAAAQPATSWKPSRVNKCIELLSMKQPIYYSQGYGGYEEGKKNANTWADYITYDMESNPLDFKQLREFMKGLVDGGPTSSGHRTPAVIVVLPIFGIEETSVDANAWMVQQALAQGVHGIILPRARNPEAVKRFVRAVRYPIAKQSQDVIGYGTRGWGSQNYAAEIWGVDSKKYLEIADTWPLNAQGEIMLGLRIEDWQALERAEETLAGPGVALAAHRPRAVGP